MHELAARTGLMLDACFAQPLGEQFVIKYLIQSRSQFPMHLDGLADYGVTEFIPHRRVILPQRLRTNQGFILGPDAIGRSVETTRLQERRCLTSATRSMSARIGATESFIGFRACVTAATRRVALRMSSLLCVAYAT